jgi:hypothetical protein
MCALPAITPGFADQTSAHPEVAEVISSDWNHTGLGREEAEAAEAAEANVPGEAGVPGREPAALTLGPSAAPPPPAQPAARNRITAAAHQTRTVRRVISAPLPAAKHPPPAVIQWDFPRGRTVADSHHF